MQISVQISMQLAIWMGVGGRRRSGEVIGGRGRSGVCFEILELSIRRSGEVGGGRGSASKF